MTSKYYLQGACAFGDKCRFSHNKEQDEPSQVCRYYLAGNCAYGDKCRYQHSKPGWSSRGQPAPSSNYSAPSGVTKPPTGGGGSGHMVKLPSGASEFGMVEAAPNWDDYMTPDEMDEFEQWQVEQAMGAGQPGQQQGGADGEDGDIMDPADIPLCNEYAATGDCSAGEECCYIHGDLCEMCGYFCIHPYNPDITAHHQLVCSEAVQGMAADASNACNGTANPEVPLDTSAEGTAASKAAAAAVGKPEAAAEDATDGAEQVELSDAEDADVAPGGDGEVQSGTDTSHDQQVAAKGDAAVAAAEKLSEQLAETKLST